MPLDTRPPEWRDAAIGSGGLWISIPGGSRTGKTVSALRLAKGLAGDKPVFGIDTEGGRMSHHAKQFKFKVIELYTDFSPLVFAELAESAQSAGAGCLICDSFSLEWNGVGGVLWRQKEYLRMKREEYARRGWEYFEDKHVNNSWAYAKEPHTHMRNRLMSLKMPIIFASRCKLVPKHLAKNQERWKIEGDKEFLWEWTLQLPLRLPQVGRVDFEMQDADNRPLVKIPDELLPIFPKGRFLGEAAGEALRAWREGKPIVLRDESQPLADQARDDAAGLIRALRDFDDPGALTTFLNKPRIARFIEMLKTTRGELWKDVDAAKREAFDRLRPPEMDDDDFPGKVTPREGPLVFPAPFKEVPDAAA
jgi:hypothetical protein